MHKNQRKLILRNMQTTVDKFKLFRGQMQTETMASTGMREAPLMTGAVTPIMDLRPGQRLRLCM